MTDSVVTQLNAALTGRYTVERELGEGGMAKVYLADDLKHERKVAIKVLNPELAALVGAERFLAEIKTTANLQHPHILPLFDSGQAGGFVFYVMPYVEGESLRERLDRDVQLPVDEAVRLATAVANALGYAHRQGVIHRDIKPENVLMHEGEPLVADFGIALAVSAAGGSRLTETGLSLGTPYYMSPEQASADRELGPQADVYSVGCMLYEMLVGDPPHTGKTAQSVLAKILTERPRSVTEIRATVPVHVAAAVARSLERLPADRFESAEDFVRALGDTGFTYEVSAATTQTAAAPAPTVGTPARSPVAKWAPWGVAAAAIAVAAWALIPEPAPAPQPTVRMMLSDFVVESTAGGGWRFTISRDGSTIVAGGAGNVLYQRRSDDTEFRPIPGTEGARHPAISPDGEWLVFYQGEGLNKVQLGGGPVLPVVGQGFQPHWFSQEEIVFASDAGPSVVSSAGGTPRVLTDNGIRPFMLPGERGIILDQNRALVVHDLETGERTTVAAEGSGGRYVPTGHILYGDRTVQSVMAVPFDLEAMEVTGDPVPVLPSVNIFSGGAVQLAVSDNGTLVYGLSSGGGGGGGAARFTWIDMAGRRTDLALDAPGASGLRVSPDGDRFAYVDGESELRVHNVVTGEITVIPESSGSFPTAAWSLDGARLFHSVGRAGAGTGWRWLSSPVDGSGPAEELVADAPGRINDISPDGRWLVGEGDQAATVPDIVYARIDSGAVEVQTYLRAEWHEEGGVVSPDGRWLAYVSDEGGPHRVYFHSFPEPGPAIMVSVGGDPVWSPQGDALYFVQNRNMMRREVRLGAEVVLGEETEIFAVPDVRTSTQFRNYDIHPDGDRFLFVTTGMVVEEDPAEPVQGIGPVVVVVNWFEELKQRMGEGR